MKWVSTRPMEVKDGGRQTQMVGKRKRLLPGRIGETECEVMLDTGASQSAILPRLMEHSQYTGSYVVLEDFR